MTDPTSEPAPTNPIRDALRAATVALCKLPMQTEHSEEAEAAVKAFLVSICAWNFNRLPDHRLSLWDLRDGLEDDV